MFCRQCGATLIEGDAFCGECGVRIKPQASPARPASPTIALKSEYSPEKKSKDIRNVIVGAAVLAFIIIGWFLASNRTSAEHDLAGSVLIMHEDNFESTGSSCSGAGLLFDIYPGSPVRVTPEGGDPIYSELERGEITPEGNCRLRFGVSIPEANRYIFEVGGRTPQTVQRRGIEHDGDWWITLGWDTNENPVPTA